MFDARLTHTVENFAALLLPLSEKDLEREWKWKDHDEEGIRFACFVTLQELRHLAVTLSTLRPQPTPAQHILNQYHAAYMNLQAALLGLSSENAEKPPAEGEWSVRQVYSHILGTDMVSHLLCAMRSRATAQARGNQSAYQMRMKYALMG